jgi:hypothetical protein
MTSPFSQLESTLSSGDLISFKYSGGSWPGVVRTLHFDSWFWTGQVKTAYMRAKELNGQMKTFNCCKMSELSLVSQPTSEEKSNKKNNISNSTSFIKKCDKDLGSNILSKKIDKQNILIKELDDRIDSQNIMIGKFKARMFLLEEDCVYLEEDKIKAYTIMTVHKRRYPSTWQSDFVPKELSN